jgi:hypothetical protein
MKRKLFFFVVVLLMTQCLKAQQALPSGKMSYTVLSKPNNIIYNDSIFKGSAQFKQLFYRTNNPEIIIAYQKHQSNKIVGQVFGFTGAIAILAGVGHLSGSTKGLGWGLIGGGFLASVAGGYFTLVGQNHLLSAVDLFNQKHTKPTVSLGLGKQSAGLVYKF